MKIVFAMIRKPMVLRCLIVIDLPGLGQVRPGLPLDPFLDAVH